MVKTSDKSSAIFPPSDNGVLSEPKTVWELLADTVTGSPIVSAFNSSSSTSSSPGLTLPSVQVLAAHDPAEGDEDNT